MLMETQNQKIAAFFRNEARPLEGALYRYSFENGSADAVLDELARFQNADGGFGHGMEPDVRLPDSSVIATSVAFQRLREVGAPANHPLVVNGCRYLRKQYDAARQNWPIIPPNIDDAPHAPWWAYDGDLMNRPINPRVEILGYLYDYADHFPANMRQSLTDSIVTHLQAQPDKMEMHDLMCCLRLMETKSLPEAVKAPLMQKLTEVVRSTVERDPAQWREYGLPPLSIIKTPDSPFAPLFASEIPQNLDFMMEQQGADGTWGPNWSWGGLWPETWGQAERDWRGFITLDNLRTLKAFGRLA
jgi:hypothetical protein